MPFTPPQSVRTLALFSPLLLLGAWRGADDEPDYAAWRASILAAAREGEPQVAGALPEHWIDGTDCATEDAWQVHRYERDTYVLRQSKCVIYEAPFLFLLIGEERAFLLDTGANGNVDVWATVRGVLEQWSAETGRPAPPLLVGHSHSHFDHVLGDKWFRDQEGVEGVVGLRRQDVLEHWGFEDYPNDVRRLELGGRSVDILGVPGHQPASIALYDRRTQLLLTGDIVYPGHLFVFGEEEWPEFVASIQRLVDWAREHPVRHVLGCHVEYSNTPGEPYAYGTEAHPDEHPLELTPTALVDILEAAHAQDGDPEFAIHDEFVLHPVYKHEITWNG